MTGTDKEGWNVWLDIRWRLDNSGIWILVNTEYVDENAAQNINCKVRLIDFRIDIIHEKKINFYAVFYKKEKHSVMFWQFRVGIQVERAMYVLSKFTFDC